MGKSVFSIFLIIMLLSSCLLLTLIAAGGEIIISAQADEEGLSSLEAGDILRVTVTLPKVENTNKLQFDLNFNDSVFSYNGDADASAVLSVLAIGKVETVGDGTIRLVAAGMSGVSFDSGTIAISASFTVKQGVFGGEKNAFSLSGLKCADTAVTLGVEPVKITVSGEETTVPDTTAYDETTALSDVTTAADTTVPPKVTAAVETTSIPEVTDKETTEPLESATTEDTSAEISDTMVDTTVPDTTLPERVDTSDEDGESAQTSDSDTTENDGKNEEKTSPAISVAIILAVVCALAVIGAFLWSKRIKLPK